MITITAKDAKEKFGVLIDTARREPVIVTRNSRPSVVVVSTERFAELEAIEDRYWIERARAAEEEGFIGIEETGKILRGCIDESEPQ